MVAIRLTSRTPDELLRSGFARIRDELRVPTSHPPEVVAEATAAVARGPRHPPGVPPEDPVDRRDLPMRSIDPPGSRDIDQAYAASRRGAGWRLHYAIADLAVFIPPGGEIEQDSLERGVTLYSPDHRASLHPEVLSEGAASLLPGQDRPALLWTIDIDADGTLASHRIERAIVRNRQAMSYSEAQANLDHGRPDEGLELLREIGEARLVDERRRGAVSLRLPAQDITRSDGAYDLVYDVALPVETWNAQLSLATGIAAANLMLDAGVGLLRTLPPAEHETLRSVRLSAKALGVEWPDDVDYPTRVRDLDPNVPEEAALLARAARAFRGAGYVAFGPDLPVPDHHAHAALATDYAHVTAPLRRVCDRYANEILLAICADRPAPEWAVDRLPELPSVMGRATQRDRALERALVDFMEAMVLAPHLGERFTATVTQRRGDTVQVQLAHPAVIASVEDDRAEPGTTVELELVSADPSARDVTFRMIG
ncbi:MAG: RNB domain-containing ribonuclease [Acidimicrobiales bacterium]|nr:RNB domain-containing ribonuclease [Acidimicrobiales bacterium]